MRYSIRGMLALTFLVALGLLVWRTWEGKQQDLAHLAELRNQIIHLEARLRLNNRAMHQAIMRTHDEFESLHTIRERAVDHFDHLRQRHSKLETRGSDVLSIRTIPSLRTGSDAPPVTYLLLVPKERPVWLKFGVHPVQLSKRPIKTPDVNLELLTDSAFKISGPFEMQLPAGEQTLKVTTGSAHKGSLPIVVTLNGKVLLHSAYVSADVSGCGSRSMGTPVQIDYGLDRPLPWLLTKYMYIFDPTSADPLENTQGFTVWLSDHSSSFKRFPSE